MPPKKEPSNTPRPISQAPLVTAEVMTLDSLVTPALHENASFLQSVLHPLENVKAMNSAIQDLLSHLNADPSFDGYTTPSKLKRPLEEILSSLNMYLGFLNRLIRDYCEEKSESSPFSTPNSTPKSHRARKPIPAFKDTGGERVTNRNFSFGRGDLSKDPFTVNPTHASRLELPQAIHLLEATYKFHLWIDYTIHALIQKGYQSPNMHACASDNEAASPKANPSSSPDASARRNRRDPIQERLGLLLMHNRNFKQQIDSIAEHLQPLLPLPRIVKNLGMGEDYQELEYFNVNFKQLFPEIRQKIICFISVIQEQLCESKKIMPMFIRYRNEIEANEDVKLRKVRTTDLNEPGALENLQTVIADLQTLYQARSFPNSHSNPQWPLKRSRVSKKPSSSRDDIRIVQQRWLYRLLHFPYTSGSYSPKDFDDIKKIIINAKDMEIMFWGSGHDNPHFKERRAPHEAAVIVDAFTGLFDQDLDQARQKAIEDCALDQLQKEAPKLSPDVRALLLKLTKDNLETNNIESLFQERRSLSKAGQTRLEALKRVQEWLKLRVLIARLFNDKHDKPDKQQYDYVRCYRKLGMLYATMSYLLATMNELEQMPKRSTNKSTMHPTELFNTYIELLKTLHSHIQETRAHFSSTVTFIRQGHATEGEDTLLENWRRSAPPGDILFIRKKDSWQAYWKRDNEHIIPSIDDALYLHQVAINTRVFDDKQISDEEGKRIIEELITNGDALFKGYEPYAKFADILGKTLPRKVLHVLRMAEFDLDGTVSCLDRMRQDIVRLIERAWATYSDSPSHSSHTPSPQDGPTLPAVTTVYSSQRPSAAAAAAAVAAATSPLSGGAAGAYPVTSPSISPPPSVRAGGGSGFFARLFGSPSKKPLEPPKPEPEPEPDNRQRASSRADLTTSTDRSSGTRPERSHTLT